MVITVVSVNSSDHGCSLVYLSRQQSLQKDESVSQHFPPPKDNGGNSVADATIMMQDEDSLVECEIGDDDFSNVASSGSTRKSRAENFLQLVEYDDKTSNMRPRQFLIANAFRMGNTWNHQE